MNARELASLQADFESLCTTAGSIQQPGAGGVWSVVAEGTFKIVDPRAVSSPFSFGAGVAAAAMSMQQGRIVLIPMKYAAYIVKERRVVVPGGKYRIVDFSLDIDDQAGIIATAQKVDA